jgi:hypothetical protein
MTKVTSRAANNPPPPLRKRHLTARSGRRGATVAQPVRWRTAINKPIPQQETHEDERAQAYSTSPQLQR